MHAKCTPCPIILCIMITNKIFQIENWPCCVHLVMIERSGLLHWWSYLTHLLIKTGDWHLAISHVCSSPITPIVFFPVGMICLVTRPDSGHHDHPSQSGHSGHSCNPGESDQPGPSALNKHNFQFYLAHLWTDFRPCWPVVYWTNWVHIMWIFKDHWQ